MRRPPLVSVVHCIVVAVVYLAAAKAGLAFASPAPQVTLVWPPAGIALAAVVLLGLGVWPGVALGAFVANVTTAEPPLTAAGIAFGNTLAAVCAGGLLRRLRFRPQLDRLRDAAALVVCGAGLSTLLAATIGVTSLCAGGVQPWTQFGALWLNWWLGDAGGVLVVATLLLSWSRRPWRSWKARERAELVALGVVASAVGVIVFGSYPGARGGELPFAYLAFPVVIVAALRHGVPAAALAVLATSSIALGGTLLGGGPFARDSSSEALLLVQTYTSVLALTGVVLGAVTLERKRSERYRTAVQATASALAAPGTLAEASHAVLRAICGNLGCGEGVLWGVDREAGALRCLGVWSRRGVSASELLAATCSHTLAPGEGLAGRVWVTGEPARIGAERQRPFSASSASGEGLRAGFGFPIWSSGQREGVVELIGGDLAEPDDSLLELMGTVSVQLGQFLERSRADAALQQSRRELAERVEQLAESDRHKDEFLAMLAHELRNPLAPIAAAADILGEVESHEPAVKQVHEILDRQIRHMVKLIDDLLDVSRVGRRKVRLELVDIDLATVIEHALEVSRGLIEARRHELELALPSERIVLHADLTRLAQALANLLNNAAKFTEPGGRIRLEAKYREGEVQICVRDTGVGIEPKLLPYVFELFFQSETTADRSHGGLGIGLTLVRTLVEMHGGEVSAASEGSGQGSAFTVRLPARLSARSQPTLERSPHAAPGRALRILLVEDNKDSADALCHLLCRRGHETHVASNGIVGLAEARALRPDVLLLDIGLPGLDGYTVARQLRESRDADGMLLVALSGYGEEADRRRAQEAGFDHYLVKPVKLDELTRILALCLASEPR